VVSKILVMAVLATAVITAQSVTTKMGGEGSALGTGPAASTTGKTVLENFADKLKLDDQTQIPAAEQLFTAATRAATPVAQEMLAQRRHMLDAEIAGKADDFKIASDAYLEASVKMASIEASAFARVFSGLKQNQKSKGPEAFALLAGYFQTVTPQRGRGRGGDQ
jgi:hypothetical protein